MDIREYADSQENLDTVYSMIMKLHGDVLKATEVQELTNKVYKRMSDLANFKKDLIANNRAMIDNTIKMTGVTEEEVVGTLVVFDLVIANVYYEERIKALLNKGE